MFDSPQELVGSYPPYHFKGADENVWIASNGKTDEHKRFCTLQLSVKGNANLGNTRIC